MTEPVITEIERLNALASLKLDIDAGLADMAAGRVQDFDAGRIIAMGKRLLAARASDVIKAAEGQALPSIFGRGGFK